MFQDIRLALRRISRAPAFSLSVILILGAGVGAAASMASVLNALAYRPLDLPGADALVVVSSFNKEGLRRNTVLPAIERLRAADLAAAQWCGYNSTLDATESGGRVLESSGELMAGDCLDAIGVKPILGRWFTPDEAPLTGAGKPVMVISSRYWHSMFDDAPDVVGRTVRIQNITATVIGVMPASFTGFSRDVGTDFVLPFNAHRASSGAFLIIGRLKPGATVAQLHEQVRALWPSLLEAVLPASATRAQLLAETTGGAEAFSLGSSTLRRLYTAPVERLSVLAGTLLVLVCLNIGGLMVARVTGRAGEIAAMRALGASLTRIARPLAAECALLAIGGAAIGVPIAYAASAAFARLLPTGNLPWSLDLTPDPIVLAAVLAAIVVMTFVIASLPIALAIKSGRQLRTDRTVSPATGIWAKGLLIAQVGVTVVMVFTSGLIVRSFNGLRGNDTGFESERLLSLRLAANPGGYQGLDAGAYYRALAQRLEAVPGIAAVGMARYFGTINNTMLEQPIGFAETPDQVATGAMDFVSPGFFGAAGVPILNGRDLAWSDDPKAARVAVVSESLARALAPNGDVIGRVIRYGTNPAYGRLQIVGVAGNLSLGNFRRNDLRLIYTSSIQVNETAFATVHLRTAGPPLQHARAATDAVAALGREHVLSVHAHNVLFDNSVVAERMGSVVSSGAAILALILSCIGLFALMSHSVERRTREIGIRVAIGATPANVSRAIVREALVLVLAGLVLGIPAAFGAARLVRSLLYEVTTTDGLTLAISVALITATGLMAALQPARKAVRVDPATALRAD